jgi:hypothetical protein
VRQVRDRGDEGFLTPEAARRELVEGSKLKVAGSRGVSAWRVGIAEFGTTEAPRNGGGSLSIEH